MTALSPFLNHLWQSTIFVAAVWLISLALRRNRAAVRYWLWLAASLKFLVPFSALAGLGSRLLSHSAPAAARAQFAVVTAALSQPFAILPEPLSTLAAPPTASALPAVLLAMWVTGVAIGLLFWLRLALQLHAIRCAAKPLPLGLPIPAFCAPVTFEPGVCGIAHPVLLLPEGIAERLTSAELGAVIAHELCHVRRRDNLTAALHMLVETIFWFHPLVWWLRGRLLEERERACDEEVLRRTADPETYAASILSVCRFYVESPTLVEGISGADLKMRIENILSHRTVARLHTGKKLLLVCAAALAVAWPIALGVARAGAQDPPRFEVASVKPSVDGAFQPAGSRSWGDVNGKVNITHIPLKFVILRAYGVQAWQMDGPDWLAADPFDIVASAPAGWTKEQLPLMFQALLADRFQLKLHRESRPGASYVLLVAAGGIKLKAASDSEIPVSDAEKAGMSGIGKGQGENKTITGVARGGPFGDFKLTMANGVLHYEYPKMTMKSLALFLSNGIASLPVVDRTDLDGAYQVNLDISSADMMASNARTTDRPGADAPAEASEPTGASVVASIQKLGLKLERRKEPLERLVIDHVERTPTAN